MKKIHLVCNAHIDPVWQWDVAEGIGAALSTFRCAADFCDEYDGFVFNHNEALLYRLVEEYEPALFERIKRHVAAGKWHIMGGFELQPDCVMPFGETYIRQILLGRDYFSRKFGVTPTAAINFDSFGHSRGLVQILKKCGYDAYVFMRPEAFRTELPQSFIWEGFDGSKIAAHRLSTAYSSLMGENAKELRGWFGCLTGQETRLYTWGVGNHGGGPSRKDLDDIGGMIASGELAGYELTHSTPEAFFAELERDALPVVSHSLYSSNVGCYTSMIDMKMQHRRLENMLLTAEKMASAAYLQGMEYPQERLDSAFRALAYIQFHDVLPGTMTEAAKKSMLNKAGFGLEIAADTIHRAFYRLAQNQRSAQENTVPVLVYNPHPYPVETVVSCEYMLANQNWDETTETVAAVYQSGLPVDSQIEQEDSMLSLDWRKRITFRAVLEPMQMNRFDCRLEVVKKAEKGGGARDFTFDNGAVSLTVNRETGLIERLDYQGGGISGSGFGVLTVFEDDMDPWHMRGDKIDRKLGQFTLMDAAKLRAYGLTENVRVIEDGAVRTVVEAMFDYRQSSAVVRYMIPKKGVEIGVTVELVNNERDRMIKLALPVAWADGSVISETMFGAEEALSDGSEFVSHRFDVAVAPDGRKLGVVNNCVYGGSILDGVLYKNLLRAPAYCAHPLGERPVLPSGRYVARMEQGRTVFEFKIIPGGADTGLFESARAAQVMNEPPVAVSFFPPGGAPADGASEPAVSVGGRVVVSAVKQAQHGDDLIVRIFEPAGENSGYTLDCPALEISHSGGLAPFEVKTLRLSRGQIAEVNMIEER